MTDLKQTILQEPSTDTDTGKQQSRYTLPPQQLAKVRSRLRFLTLVFFCMCGGGLVVDWFFRNLTEHAIPEVYIFNGLTSVVLHLLTLSRRLSDRTILNLGLVYEILMCATVALGYTWLHYQNTGKPPEVSWVCIVLVTYPLIIPTPPRRTFLVAFLAATTMPLALLLLTWQGSVTSVPIDYVVVSITPMFCVALAVLSSSVVYGLNIEIAKAMQMGSYQLKERLGQGGMGEVWRASHHLLARPAAIKLVRPEIQIARETASNEMLLERFSREAQVTSALQSPHTVSLYDFGTTDEGTFYYVMELLNGLDLESLVKQYGPIPCERTIHILKQACHSLREAHDRGLVHRDIKPANLVLCCRYAGDHDFIKVLDFGLVALRPEMHPDSVRLTGAGQTGGTPAYMPPEMITDGHIDGRTDIYALGCVAYWLLTGQLVFTEETPMNMALAHVRNEPVVPSSRTELEIPPALDEVVLSCLAKDPAQRPPDAADLLDRLRTIEPKSEWNQERARQWWEIHQPTLIKQNDLDLQ